LDYTTHLAEIYPTIQFLLISCHLPVFIVHWCLQFWYWLVTSLMQVKKKINFIVSHLPHY